MMFAFYFLMLFVDVAFMAYQVVKAVKANNISEMKLRILLMVLIFLNIISTLNGMIKGAY